MWNSVCGWLQTWIWTILQWIRFGTTGRPKQIAKQRSARKPRPQAGNPRKTHKARIRQLLCDNKVCEVCELVAEEATRFFYSLQGHSHDPPGLEFSLPPEPCTELPVLHGAARDLEECSHWSLDRDSEDTFSVSSTTVTTSIASWTRSSFGLSEATSCCRLEDFSFKQQKGDRGHFEEAFAETHRLERVAAATVLTVQRDVVSRTKIRAALLPAGPHRTSQVIHFSPQKILFLEDTEVASLESHLVNKRVHHLLGLPVALSRSLRSFMPPAPPSAPQSHSRDVNVVTKPQELPFVAMDTRKDLELHVKKMVQLKRWQLPWRVQASLRHMKPPFEPRESAPSAFQKPEPMVIDHVEHTNKTYHEHTIKSISRLPTSAPVLDAKAIAGSQGKLRAYFAKKSLERKLEVFPALVGHSQKMVTKSRKVPLPKLIPVGHCCPQRRTRGCLSLQRKADVVEISIKCKSIHYLWGLPTLYMESLAKMAPAPPSLPTGPSRVRGSIEFGPAEPPFLALRQRKDLESHVLRKRLQHQWGLPGLVQQSLREFLAATSPPTHVASVADTRLGVNASVGFSPLLFSTLKVKQQQLETHLRRKVVEKQWGLPRRVLESLRVFVSDPPSMIKRPREVEKTFSKGKAEKRKPRSFLEQRQDWERQALQRHVAKKALEVQLGMAASVVLQSWKDACQRGRHVLCKAIPPCLKPIQPRSQELPFVGEAALCCIQFNIIHKNLTYKWGLPTLYNTSLAQLFQRSVFPTHTASVSVRSIPFCFTGRETLFNGRRTRETLEDHVKRKSLQHTWGLPGLIQKSLWSFLPAVPRIGLKAEHREVAVFNTDLSFLSQATKQALERNVQKRTLHQRWLLPRRVLDSLKLLYPEHSFGRGLPQIAVKEQGARQEDASPPLKQVFSNIPMVLRMDLQRHLAKKSLELHLEAFPTAVRASWGCTSLVARPLPKMISPGDRHLLPRRSLLPFAGQRQVHRIEVAVRRNQLACLWGLGLRQVGALGGMVPPHSPRQRRAATDFTGVRMSLPPGFDREALERHVKRKRIQHEWGFPALVHRSLRAFMQGPPSLASSVQTDTRVCVVLPDGLFLPQDVCHRLEAHLQKMKLHRLWGLPGRVLDSLRMLRPESKAGAPRPEPSGASDKVGRETALSVSAVQVRAAASVPCAFRASRKGSQNLAKLQLHWAKKQMEMQLEAFPVVVVRSWRCAGWWKPREPLPRLVLPGCKPLQARKDSLPFVPKERADMLELTVILCHFWGLSLRHEENLQALLPPRLVYRPPEAQRAAFRLSRGPVRVQEQTREMLELHVRKKRLQHQWGLPLLVQRSLGAFMQDTALGPASPRTTLPIHIGQQGLPFLPESTYSHLEHHVQRQKLQRKWGLPRRVQDSLKGLLPEVPQEQRETPSRRSSARAPGHGTGPRACPGGAKQAEQDQEEDPGMPWRALRLPQIRFVPASVPVETLQQHLAKKGLEVRSEAFPAVVRASWGHVRQRQPLPKPTRPDPQAPTPRRSTFSVGREGVNRIEHALQGHRVASSWGLGARHVDAVAGVAPRLPSPLARTRETPYEFSEARTPFFGQRWREALERHIGKKRIQHTWGLPALVQRSLQSFIQETPRSLQKDPEPSRSAIDICVLHQELPFLPRDTRSHLERHLQRTKIQQKWGLPGKVQESLKAFLPSAAFEAAEGDEKCAQAGPSRVRTRQVLTHETAPKNARASESRLPRKRLQMCPEGDPMLLSQSPAGQRGRELKHLPRLVHKGQKQPISRPATLLSLRPRTVTNLDMNVKHKYLAFLSGLPYKGSGPLAIVDHGSCPPVQIGQARSRFQKLQTPLSLKEAGEMLEGHIQKKRLHRFWGLPSAIQRSLLAFAPPASPSVVRPPHRVARKIRIQVEHLPFVSECVQDDLEASLKKMVTCGQWALPKKVQKFLHGLTPNALAGRDLQGSVPRSSSSYGHDRKKYIVRMSEVTYVEAPSKEIFSEVPVTFFPIAELFKHSNILDAHLKKKNLEIKFQLIPAMVHRKALAGPVKEICLPKCPLGFSVVKPRTAFPRFVDEESLAKIQQNISRKYLTYLWGLPSLHTESLSKLFGNVPKFVMPRDVVFLIGDAPGSPRLGRDAAGEAVHQGRWTATSMVSAESVYASPALGPPLLTDEALELLESHTRNKKLQHLWGLPTIVQKSLRKFAPTFSEPQRPLVKRGLAAATPSQGAREVRVAAQRWPSFDPAPAEPLEAYTMYYIGSYKWRLSGHLQEMLKKSLPPESHFLAEGSKGQAQTLLCRCGRPLQAAPEQAPREVEGLPRNQFHQVKDTAERPPEEASSLLDFHVRQKRIQHAWGLPSIVQKSLRAFAQPPPTPSPGGSKAAALVAERAKGRGSVTVQTPQYGLHVTTSSLPFLSPSTIAHLESHLRERATKHKWKFPQVIQDSLRAFIQPEPPEEQKGTIYPNKRQLATDRSAGSALLLPEQEPTLFPREIRHLLEFHIQRKRIQHAWGLPSTVLKSLNAFAPPPLGPEKHTPATEKATTAHRPPWVREGVNVVASGPSFLSADAKEHLESHLRRRIAVCRWQLSKHAKKSLKAFQPAVSPPGESRPPNRPWLPHDAEPLQDTLPEPQVEAESSAWTLQGTREASAEGAGQRQPSPTPPISARAPSAERGAGLPGLTAAAERELERHIQHKKIQHEWGLPKAVQRSLQAFAPVPLEPRQSLLPAQGGRPKSILAGLRESWEAREGKTTAQELHFLDPKTTEALEAHVGTLAAEHKWRIAGLLQKSVAPFVLAASPPPAVGPKEQGVLSSYYRDMTLSVAGLALQVGPYREASSGSKEPHRYRSELYYHFGPARGPAPRQAAETCPPCPAAEPQQAAGAGGSREAGRTASRIGSLQRITLQESSLQLHGKEGAAGQHARIPAEAGEPGLPPVSPPGPPPSPNASQTSCRTEALPGTEGAASARGRSRGRDPVPRSSKQISWQPGYDPRRRASSSHSRPRTEPRKGSKASRCSGPEQRQRQQEEAAKTEDGESQTFSSSSSEDKEQEADAQVAAITWAGSSSSMEHPQDLESHSSYEDLVATHYRPAERGRRGRGSRKRPRRGSLLGWCKCSRESWPCQTPRGGPAGSTSAEVTLQGNQPQTGTAEGGEAEGPHSSGGVSQLSTECEWEEVGDWDSEEAAVGESTRLGEEEGGSATAAGGEVDSPAAELPQASPGTALVRESRGDKELCLSAGQAASEPFGHGSAPRSAGGETGSKTEASPPPEQPPGALQSVAFSLEVQASAETKHSEVWLCSGGEDSPAVGEAATAATGQSGAGTHQSTRKEELSWGREAPPKEPSGGQEALAAVKVFDPVPLQSEGQPPQESQEPEFVGVVSADERCSIVARILERKMNMRHGLYVWRRSHERLAAS